MRTVQQTCGKLIFGGRDARKFACHLAIFLFVTAGCVEREGPDAGPGGKLFLQPQSTGRVLGLGESATLFFSLKDIRQSPASGQLVRFRVTGDGDNPGKGATLNVSEAVSDGNGSVSVGLQAGVEAKFAIEATTSRADRVSLPVTVTGTLLADVSVVPVIDPNSPPLSALTLALYDGQNCASLALKPPFALNPPTRPIQSLSAQIEAHSFLALSTTEMHAAVGIGRRQDGVARAIGCVDIRGNQLSAATAVRFYLPLTAYHPLAAGIYALSTEWEFAPVPTEVNNLADAWKAQADCPLSPSNLWLDCTIDALTTGANDPLDCRPGANEGPLGLALQARRGTLENGTTEGCAGRQNKDLQPSLEALLFDAWQSNATGRNLLTQLPVLADKVKHMFDRVRVTSLMEIVADGAQTALARTHHRLVSAEVAIGPDRERVILNSLGLPALESRQIPTTRTADRVAFNTHAFSMRLGSTLRHAFVSRALRQPELANGIDDLTARIADALRIQSTTGCEALDRLLCGELGTPPGCLQDACTRGLQAWTASLSDGFSTLDGEGLDFTMSGSAKTGDTNADFIVDRLGSLVAGGLPPGLWDGVLRTRSGDFVMNGVWVGTPATE